MLICSCGGEKQSAADESQSLDDLLSERLEKAKTWEDSVIAVEGTFLGGYYRYLLNEVPGLDRESVVMKDVERGIRQVMAADSADMSYIYGLQIGMQLRQTYLENIENQPMDKGKFMEQFMKTFRIDSLPLDQLQQLGNQFEDMMAEVAQRHQAEVEKEIFNSAEAEQNRIIGQSFASKFQSNPDFSQIENTGIYMSVQEEGTGELLQDNDRVKVTYTVLHLGGEPVENGVEKAMFPMRAYNPMLTAVLKHMRHGQKAHFFIPYEYAYGIQGNPGYGIGPCESLYLDVEVL